MGTTAAGRYIFGTHRRETVSSRTVPSRIHANRSSVVGAEPCSRSTASPLSADRQHAADRTGSSQVITAANRQKGCNVGNEVVRRDTGRSNTARIARHV